MGKFRVKYKKGGREPYHTAIIEIESVENAKEALAKLKAYPQMYRELNYSNVEIIDVENLVEVKDL